MYQNFKRTFFLLVTLALFAGAGWAADNDNHTVTLNLSELHELIISGGNVILTMPTPTGGAVPAAQSNSATTLDYTVVETGISVAKINVDITVNDVPAGTSMDIGNDADGVNEGTDAGDAVNVNILSAAVDIITGIGSVSTGTGTTLTYTWTFDDVTLLDAANSKVVTVTYTLVDGA